MREITFQDVLSTQQQAVTKIGQRAVTPDGREWVYAKDSGSGCSKGHVMVPAAVTSVGTTISSSTDAQGNITIITKAAAGWTVGAFANGFVLIDGGTGIGQIAKIKDNSATQLFLQPEYALGTALDGTSTMKIWTPGVVRKALITSKIQNAIGIAQVTFNANDYGWLLTRGVGIVIADAALTVGGGFVTGAASVPGQVVVATTAKGTLDEQALGTCLVAGGANGGCLVNVNI